MWLGAKRGLMKSLAGVIGVGAAFFGASWCANRFVTPVSRWLEPLLRESIRQKLSGQDGADAGELLSAFAFDTHSLEKILEDVAQRVKETGESVFSAVTESVSHSIAYGIVYAAAFIAILLVVWLLLKPLDLAGKLPVVRTVQAARTEEVSSSSSKLISTLVRCSRWQRGISSEVFLAPMIPATRATPSTSPFPISPSFTFSKHSRLMEIRPSATASLAVSALALTSTMTASPWRLKCVNSLMIICLTKLPVSGTASGFLSN